MQFGLASSRSLALYAKLCTLTVCCALCACSPSKTDSNAAQTATAPTENPIENPTETIDEETSGDADVMPAKSDQASAASRPASAVPPRSQSNQTTAAPIAKQPPPISPLANSTPPENVEELYAQAEAVGKHLVASNPQTIDAREILARIYWTTGKPLKAQEVWKGVLADSPNYPYALHGLGQVAAKVGDFEAAAAYHHQAFQALPSFIDAGLSTAGAWTKVGKLEQAQQLLEKIAKQFPAMPLAWIRLGQAHTAAKDFERAKVAFEQATKLAPQDTDALYGLAIALSRTGNREEAKRTQAQVQELRKKLRSDTLEARKKNDDFQNQRREIADKYNSVGQIFFAAKQYKDAQTIWESAAQLDPQSRPVREALAALHMGFQDAEAALKVCQELLVLQPDNSQYQLNVAMMLDRSGQTANAIPMYLQLAQQSSSAQSYAMLADAYARLGDAQAIKYIEKAIELAPSNPQWSQLKQQYQQALAK
ncbi:MAG TPA: hypothetical protein DDW52_00885 [Planctomycetaceae bacterium]|nr:hypothetical protein [Planctomycetaceae bacterium]